MQLQIECNKALHQQQPCWICNQLFEMKEAKIIVCSDQGKRYGEVCPECLEKGFNWLSYQFEQLNKPKPKLVSRKSQELEISIGA